MTGRSAQAVAARAYAGNYDHLADELRALDLLIQQRVRVLRRQLPTPSNGAAPYRESISHEEADRLLAHNGARHPEPALGDDPPGHSLRRQVEQWQEEIATRVATSVEQGVFLALPQLAHLFGLSPFDLQTIVICLAPELERKYDYLYAYLQDDITRKKPSIDLVLDLLCPLQPERWRARALFSEGAPLFRAGILHATEDAHSPSGSSGLAQFLQLDPRILGYILGHNAVDGRLLRLVRLYSSDAGLEEVSVDPAIKARVMNRVQHHLAPEPRTPWRLVFYFHGPYGVGRRSLALGLCARLDCPLLYVDADLLAGREPEIDHLLQLAFREGLLLQAALYIDNVDRLLQEGEKAQTQAKMLAGLIAEYGWLVFLGGTRPWPVPNIFDPAIFQAVELPVPDVPLRQAVWERVLGDAFPGAGGTWAGQLAGQFRLTPGQIHDAVAWAGNRQAMQDDAAEPALPDLYAACRAQSVHKLDELAVKVEPRYGWGELVLPEGKLAQLREICAQVKHRYRVFGEWGFERKLAHGKGLSVLFSGSPGTGKTMAAQVIARELQLDLYKIDLSGVVSKYIGETEKNLARIFQEAETSNAILFFDEADALFGKRTEVSDAHDRYANIETSYLLQKMEEYEGVVILATNLRENMDDAFTRRIRFIVEFPFPDAASRLRIWQTHFPPEAPLGEDIDCAYLSKQFQIAGGNIKNVVLNAAFFAAESGTAIQMEHVLRGMRREYEKIGKLWHA